MMSPTGRAAGFWLAGALVLAQGGVSGALAEDVPLPGARDDGAMLYYTMELTNPGTRSQGWIGTLLVAPPPADGSLMDALSGPSFGTFVDVACNEAWVPCGMIHEDMFHWMESHEANIVNDGTPWRYELYVTAPGSRSEGWRGDLLRDGEKLGRPADGQVLSTPMGPFVWQESGVLWGEHGWFPVSWGASEG